MSKNRSPRVKAMLVLAAAVALAAGSSFACAAAADVPETQVFTLRNAEPRRVSQWLKELGLAETVSEISSAKAILVTCAAGQSTGVRAAVDYIDSLHEVQVRELSELPLPTDWPSLEEIALESGLKLGDFAEAPAAAPGSVVVDIINDSLSAMGRPEDIDKLAEAIAVLRNGPVPSLAAIAETAAGMEIPAGINGNSAELEGEAIFEELLKALAAHEELPGGEYEAGAEQAESAQGAGQPGVVEEDADVAEATDVVGEEEEIVYLEERPDAIEETPAAAGAGMLTQEQLAELIRTEVARALAGAMPAADEQMVDLSAEAAMEPEPEMEFDVPAADLEIMLDLPERLEIVDLLDLLGKYLNLNYMYDQSRFPSGTAVNLRVQGKIRVGDLYAIAENVLRFRNFAMTRSGNLVTVRPMTEHSPGASTFVEGRQVRPGDAVVTRIFQLQHASTSSANDLLTRLGFANNGTGISQVAESGTLIITDYAIAMPRIEELLSVIDRPGQERAFKFRKLQYTMARNLAPKLKELAEQLGTVAVSVAEPSRTAPTPTRTTTPRTPLPTARVVSTPDTREGVYVDYDERTNRLLIVGVASDIAVIDELIDALDVAQEDLRSLKKYTIAHVDISEIVQTLRELGVIQDAQQETRTAAERAAARAAAARPAAERAAAEAATASAPSLVGGPIVEPPLISRLPAANALLINATDEQHEAIATVIAYVDHPRGETSVNYVVYPLENQSPTDLKEILDSLISGRITDVELKVERGPAGDERPTAADLAKMEEEITIVADENTYSLIVYASKRNQQWISSVINELDEYRPQVLLDVMLVEVFREDAFRSQVDMIAKFGPYQGGTLERLTGDISAQGNVILPWGDFPSSSISEATSIGGTGRYFFGDRHIQALIEIMEEKRFGRVMSRPQLLVNDNQEGTIESEDTVYVRRTKTTYVSTTDGEGGIISQPIEETVFDPYNAGVTLTITPHISKGDNLRLNILLDRTNLGTIDPMGERPPAQFANRVTSIVTVPDNSTIILGGLEDLNQSKGGSKVPILGDIPLVGGLFRHTSNIDEQRKLYIFIKAHILRPGMTGEGIDPLVEISNRKREDFEELERRMQTYQDWPGLKGKPMEPIKVLESY